MTPPEKRRLVFVDDETQVLSALRAALRRERKRWDMRFFSSGVEALAALVDEPAEVIVTDMRMPGMNGAEFLARVTELLPHSVRLVLSGEAAESLTVSAIPYAHQWISKPTESSELVNIIERALTTRDLTHSGRAYQIVTSVAKLPVLPQVYQALSAALAEAEVCLDRVCELVQRQPSVSARVLQMSNSAFFGLPRRIDSIREAVSYLGLDTIKQLVFAAEVICELGPEDGSFPMDAFLQRATATSTLAAQLMTEAGMDGQSAASAGLLHDIGRLVLIQSGEQGKEYARQCKGQPEEVWLEEEQRIFGAGHAEVGGALLGVWGLPHDLVEAVAYHHNPDPLCSSEMSAAIAVHIAQAIVRQEQSRLAAPSQVSSAAPISEAALALVESSALQQLTSAAQSALSPEAAA